MISAPFFYENFTGTQFISLSDSNIHYIVHVLRMKEGEHIIVTNGKGMKVLAVLKNVSKRHCELEILETAQEKERDFKLHLAISFTKNAARMEWLLEKVTELGIESITPLITQRSERSFTKKERFEKILIAAMLQSQQTYLPVLNDAASLPEVVNAQTPQKYIAYCGSEYEKHPLHQVMKAGQDTLFFIGPEGDFTADEVHLCSQNQCEVVQLGLNRLRTETAGLFVCTFFNAIQ